MRKIYSFLLSALIASVGFVGAAQAQSIDEMLASPKVDDIFVARLDHFSTEGFVDASGNETGDKMFGMLRLISIKGDDLVFITEMGAWPIDPDGAYDELKGDFSDIEWDFDEKVKVKRSELASLKKTEMILRGRRLTAQQIQDFL